MNEDQREKLQLFLSRLGSVSPRRWIILTGALIIGGVLLSVWNNYGLVIVTRPSGVDTKSSIKYIDSDNPDQSLINIGPLVFVPRENNALSVSAADYQSVVSVTIPWFGFTSVTLPASITNGVEKYTADSPGCANYDSENDKLIDYTCQSPTEFSTTDIKTGFNQTITPLLTTSQSSPFLNGVIGITDNAVGQLLYQDYSGAASYLKKPDDLTANNLLSSTIITNRNDKTNTSFVILPLSGDIYIGNYTNSEVSYSKIPHPKQWNTTMASICQLISITVYCYQGVSGVAPSNNDASSTSNNTDGSILKIDISSPTKISVQRYIVDSTLAIDGIYIANDGNATVTSTNRIYNFSFSGNKVDFHQLAGNIKSATSTGNGIYFAKENVMYKLQKNAAVSIFHSDDLNIDNIFADNGYVFFAARTSKVGTELGVYKITTSPDTFTKTLLNILTNQTEYSDDISDINFIKNNVYIRVKITIDKKASRVGQAVDQNEYSQVKNRISQQLSNSGLKVSDLNIVYSY